MSRVARNALVLVVLALLSVFAAPGALADTPLPALAPGETALSWQLVGVGHDGRSLRLWVPGWHDRCGFPGGVRPRVDFVAQTATQISLRLVKAPDPTVQNWSPGDPDSGVPFACPAMAAGPPRPLIVPLDLQLVGQQIGGPDRTVAAIPAWTWLGLSLVHYAPTDMGGKQTAAPSLIGLRLTDALEILRSIGVAKSAVRFARARHGYVTEQLPRRGQMLPSRVPRITLTGARLPAG